MAKKKMLEYKLKSPIENIGLIKSKRSSLQKQFRIPPHEVNDLKTIQTEVNKIANLDISESKIIRALIKIGIKTDRARIVQALRELI